MLVYCDGLFQLRPYQKRTTTVEKIAAFLGTNIAAPTSFSIILSLNNKKSWFFTDGDTRQPEDIDKLGMSYRGSIRSDGVRAALNLLHHAEDAHGFGGFGYREES